MRPLLILALAAIASPALADTYALTNAASDRQCIVYDGQSSYTPANGWTLSTAPVSACVPVIANPPPRPTVIPASAFQARFTQTEQQAIWAAAAKDTTGAIGAGLTRGLTSGEIDLTDAVVKAWMDALVAAGAITGARETAILTP